MLLNYLETLLVRRQADVIRQKQGDGKNWTQSPRQTHRQRLRDKETEAATVGDLRLRKAPDGSRTGAADCLKEPGNHRRRLCC